MKHPARCQALIELLDTILTQQVPVDYQLHSYFKARRYIGSQDRRYIKDTFYHILRQLTDLQNVLEQFDSNLLHNSRILFMAAWVFNHNNIFDHTIDLNDIFNGQQYAPNALSTDEQQLLQKLSGIVAQGLTASLPHAIQAVTQYPNEIIQAYNQPAPLDLRVNTLKTSRAAVLKQLQQLSIDASVTPYSPIGIRLNGRISLKQFDFYQMGHVEIQDEGSQLAGYLALVKPDAKILDLCAGNGGKTLQLAALMHNCGTIIATDISAQRLNQCRGRLQHAGVTNVTIKDYAQAFDDQYDSIIIDAPCSGSGTWRRHPELKIHLTADKLQHYMAVQSELLIKAAALIPIGGTIVYLTCSFFNCENEDQIDQFLTAYPNFITVPASVWPYDFLKPFTASNFLKLGPLNSNTDGFFGVVLTKIS